MATATVNTRDVNDFSYSSGCSRVRTKQHMHHITNTFNTHKTHIHTDTRCQKMKKREKKRVLARHDALCSGLHIGIKQQQSRISMYMCVFL